MLRSINTDNQNAFLHSRAAFTLVELLVVIAIIGTLVTLLLPAVNAARAAARNAQCQNRIRQLAMAIVNYESAHREFPISQTASGRQTSTGCEGGFYSWHARILPYIEATNLYERIDFKIDLSDQCNDGEHGFISGDHPHANVAMAVVDTFLCPSDSFLGDNSGIMQISTAPDNYAGNAGWPSLSTGVTGGRKTPGKQNGIINVVNPRKKNAWQPRRAVRAQQVTDGLSKTACVAERLIQRGTTQQRILDGSNQTLSFHLTERPRTLAEMASRCSPEFTHADLSNSAYLGRSWMSGWSPTGPTYMHVKEPNSNHCHFSHSFSTGDFVVTPTSNHSGGVNVAFADGHVQFIQDGIDPQIWWAMGSRNGRERISESY